MRTWLYSTLTTDPALATLLGVDLAGLVDRVFQGESLDTRLIPRPYLVYTLGNKTDETLSEEDTAARQFFTLFIHDEPFDFTRVDFIVNRVKALLSMSQVKSSGIITVRHLETSRDLDDSTLGTILRYVRFQAIMES